MLFRSCFARQSSETKSPSMTIQDRQPRKYEEKMQQEKEHV